VHIGDDELGGRKHASQPADGLKEEVAILQALFELANHRVLPTASFVALFRS
jgi:hypothetical protein